MLKQAAGTCFCALIVAGTVQAATKTYSCTQGKSTRKVEHTTGEGGEFACKVVYTKETEAPNDSKTLWSARADEKFCDEKVVGFLEKLKSGGWNCEEKAAQ